MSTKILLPLDGTRESEQVVSLIAGDCEPDTEIVLLHVLKPVQTTVVAGQVLLGSQREEAEIAEALTYLTGVAQSRIGNVCEWRCMAIIDESPSTGIVEFAESEGVDMIVMFARERKGLVRLMRGNTAREVEQKAKIKVRVITTTKIEEARIQGRLKAHTTVPTTPIDKYSVYLSGVEDVRKAAIFEGLTRKQVERIVSLGKPRSFVPGETLGEPDGKINTLFIILAGEAQLSMSSHFGDIPVRVVGPGDAYPLTLLLGTDYLITTGKALTDMRVYAIPREQLIKLCEEDSETGMSIYKTTAQVFARRYSTTLSHLSLAAERELRFWRVLR